MSDEILESGIVADAIKIDEKFVLKLTKEIKNVNKEVKDSCKVIHFSSECSFEEVLLMIDGLDPKEYPQLFIFVTKVINFGFSVEHQQGSTFKLTKIQEKLLKFGSARPIILQLTSEDEHMTKFYYKDETSSQFNVIDHQQDESEYSSVFSSFLLSFFNGKFYKSEIEVFNAVREFKNCSLVLRFLQALQLSDGFFGTLVLDVASERSKSEFLAALDSPFDSNGRVLSYRRQKYISDVFGDDDDPENDTSVLLTAIENKNTDVIDYLITYWTHLIQQLPVDHQVKISTAAFETNQLDGLCDLLDIVDYPFPDNFEPETIEHARLHKITAERNKFNAAIEADDFDKIDEFIKNNSNLKFIHNSSNKSALVEAVNLKKYATFYYLKSLGFKGEKCDDILLKLSKEEKEEAVKLATDRRKENVSKSEDVAPKSVMLLSMRSSVHNSRTKKIQATKYREKIMKWFIDIHKVAPELIDVAASCNNLKIIFDFESESVENMSLTGSNAAGSMYPSSKWIFVSSKLSDKNGNVTKQREQKIKGVLAHELCHYVMRLVYDNQEKPYYKDREDMKEMFEEVVKIIDQWSSEDSECPDDKCNGIISSVFRLYDPKDFHPELIVRVVQIMSEFDDSEDKLKHLHEKYEVFFDFWHGQVIPELQKYLQKNQEVIRLNGTFGLLSSILKLKYELRNGNEVEKLIGNKIVVVQTNVPKLLFLNIHKYLRKKIGNLCDSQNIFVDTEKLNNQQLLDDFKQICLDNQELSIFVDCTFQVPDGLGNVLINKELNFIFIVSNEAQCDKVDKIFKEQKIDNAQKLELNYNWSDLTEESQLLLLESKINFQNNSQITLNDLIEIDSKASEPTENDNEDIKDLVDDQLLNLFLENHQVLINTKENSEKYFQLLFKPRDFIKKTKVTDEDVKLGTKHENSDSEDEKPSGFFGKIFSVFGTNKSKTSSLNQSKFKEQKISKDELLLEVKDHLYVLISDQAGNGKSWAMKNLTRLLREHNPTSWVTYVDLKQFIDEFKACKDEPEFSTFMVEKILKLQQEFEVKIFQKMYKNGKVLILFDGFDEIAPNCAEFVSKLAQNFQQNGGNQLWIATRDFFEVDLKEKLNLDIAYRLDEMTEKEGVDLIARSWVFMSLKDKNEPKSKEEFEECIKMSTNFDIYQQKSRQLVEKALISRNNSVGLPQLFKMIADGFKDEKNLDDLQGSKIYVKFIDILYIRWSRKKGQIREEANVKSQKFELSFYKFHQYHAILSLFPELAATLFPGYDGSEWPEEEVIACALMTKINGKFYFLHETFREYFVAEAIAKALRLIKIEKKVIKYVNEILSVDKFKIIRSFLFPVLNEKSVLEQFKPKIQRLILSEDTLFSEFFIENQDNLVDFAIQSLKNGKYEKVIAVLNANASSIVSNAQTSKTFLKFENFVFDFLKIDDLKNLIIKQQVMQEIVGSRLEIEMFEDFATKVEAKADREFIRQGLMHKSKRWTKEDQNIFYFLSTSPNLSARKVNKFLKIMEEFLTDNEIFELMSKCNDEKENILHVCVWLKNKGNLDILWTEMEKYFAVRNFPQTFKEFVKQHFKYGNILLHSAALCDNIEIYETLWEYLFITFEDRNELRDFILQKDNFGINFVHTLVSEKKNLAIIEWTFNILRENFNKDQFQEILTSESKRKSNLIQTAVFTTNVLEVHKFLWKFFRTFCGTDEKFKEMIKEVDSYRLNIFHKAAWNSSSEVFEFLIQELEKIISRDEIREMMKHLEDRYNYSFLQTASEHNKSSELHKSLWKTLRKYFENSEILEFIEHVDKLENNLILVAISNSTKEILELTWNEIKSFLNHDEQVDYLKIKEGKTLIEMSMRNHADNQGVDTWVKTLVKNYKINI